MNRLKISGVANGSIAMEAGVEPGDSLLSINRQPIQDVFDYRFLSAEEEVFLEIEKSDGSILEVEIEKEIYEDIGLVFEKPLLDEEKSCRNKCVFCFIDQLPSGMRKSLYYKDDDARLSFLFGNYITMTNMDQNELERIIRYRMSPVNVSVHTTNPELRTDMLGNRFAGDILTKMKYLQTHGILLNTQIVLCRGINDGKELDRTLGDLSKLIPGLQSISIVPVGLTRFRDNLPYLRPYDKLSMEDVIQQVEKWQDAFMKNTGSRKVYLSDEWYLTSENSLPTYAYYEDFPQIENGVGMTASLIQEFRDALSGREKQSIDRVVSIATGTLIHGTISRLAKQAEAYFPGLKIHVYPIKNSFFGNTVTVTGLLTGMDIKKQLLGKPLGDRLLLSSTMFRADTDIMLDDLTLDDLNDFLGTVVKKVENRGEALLDAILV